MDDNSNDNHPSRIINSPANPWGNPFGHQDWRGGVHHEWHANGVGVMSPDQIRTILQSNQVQWTDYTTVKKNIAFTQIEIYNLESSKKHFERYIADDKDYIDRAQSQLDKEIELLIKWRINANTVYASFTNLEERQYKRNNMMNKIMTDIFNTTCRLYEMKIHLQHYYDEYKNLEAILTEMKAYLTELVKAVLESDPDCYDSYTGPRY